MKLPDLPKVSPEFYARAAVSSLAGLVFVAATAFVIFDLGGGYLHGGAIIGLGMAWAWVTGVNTAWRVRDLMQ